MNQDATDQLPMPPPGTESHGQREATEAETAALVASSQEYLGKHLPQSLSGLAVESGNLRFTPAGVAALNSSIRLLIDGQDRAIKALEEERQHARELQERLGTSDVRAAVAEAKLKASEDSVTMKLIASGVGFALLALIPWVAEKAGVIGGVVAGVLGALLAGCVLLRARGTTL